MTIKTHFSPLCDVFVGEALGLYNGSCLRRIGATSGVKSHVIRLFGCWLPYKMSWDLGRRFLPL